MRDSFLFVVMIISILVVFAGTVVERLDARDNPACPPALVVGISL
jgi:hypothetical protein